MVILKIYLMNPYYHLRLKKIKTFVLVPRIAKIFTSNNSNKLSVEVEMQVSTKYKYMLKIQTLLKKWSEKLAEDSATTLPRSSASSIWRHKIN